MQYTEAFMNTSLNQLLLPGEKNLCAVYCGFPDTGFFARPGTIKTGFLTCTDYDRLLIAKNYFGKFATGSFRLNSLKQLKIKKNLFGQQVIEAVFSTEQKDIKLKMQIAPKVFGVDFPNQKNHLDKLLEILQKYETP